MNLPIKTSLCTMTALIIILVGVCLSAAPSERRSSNWKAPAREAERKNPIPSDAKSIAAGKAAYAKNCASCHGPAGKGDGPKGRDLEPKPSDLSSPQAAGQSDGAIYWKITTGRRPMPSFAKLVSEEQRWQIVDYLRTIAPGGHAPAGH